MWQDGLHGVRVDRCGRAAGLVAAHEPAAVVNASSHSSESNYLHHSRRNLLFGWILPCRLDPWRPRAADRNIVCSHVDYLYEHAGEITSSQQWRRELSQLKDECDAVPERWDVAHPHMRNLVNRYQAMLLMQARQNAACHALHSVRGRLCRWLLQSQDMIGSASFTLTQEFLSHMLGVRRNSVSVEAHALQEAGLIRYTRGQIKILNRGGLEDCACECYSVIREETDKLMGPAQTQSEPGA